MVVGPNDQSNSVDTFGIEHGRLHAKVGLRPSRSFELLPSSGKEAESAEVRETEEDPGLTFSVGHHSLPYGASPT